MLCGVMNLLPDMLTYWRRPFFHKSREKVSGKALMALLKLLGFSFAAVFLISIVTGLLLQGMGLSRPDVSEDFAEMMNSAYFFFGAVILAPFIEEVLFRSWLGSVWGVLLVLPLLLWAVALILFLYDKALEQSIELAIIIGISLLIGAYCVQYCRTASKDGHHEAALQRVFPFIFWVIAIGFGALHLTNYQESGLGVLAFLVIIPQIFMGAVLGFLRMRFGLLCAIGFHAIYNGVLVGLTLLIMRSVA
jgi:membrane protease YdiL (CAAX protease family)